MKQGKQRLENILDKQIITADGKPVGHVFDIQLSQDGKNRVIALMYGRQSLLFRLHIYKAAAIAFDLQLPKTIPWDAVDVIERTHVRLKPGYQP